MHSCEKIIQSIWEFLDNEVDKAEVPEIQKHLDLCRSCFTRVEFEQMLRDHMRKATHRVCPDKLKQRIKNLIDQY